MYKAIIKNSNFIGNEYNGLELYACENVSILDSYFSKNVAEYGGAMQIVASYNTILKNLHLEENEATKFAGSIAVSDINLEKLLKKKSKLHFQNITMKAPVAE